MSIASTDQVVIDFIYNLREAYSNYLNKLALREKIGRDNLTQYKFKAFLLSGYLRILIEYFDNTYAIVTVNNFFDTDEIYDCLQHFNNLAETSIYLDFNA